MVSNEMAAVPAPVTTASMNMGLTQIKFRCWTGESQVSKEDAAQLLGLTNDDNYKVVKKLLDQDILKHIRSIQGHCKRAVEKYSLRFPLDNVIAVPTKAQQTVFLIVQDYQQKVDQAVEVLINGGTFKLTQQKSKTIDGYLALKEEAKKELGSGYREEDYPSPDALRQKFAIHMMPWFDLSSSTGTSGSGMTAILDQFKDEATAALKAEFYGLIKHIVEKLQDKYDEKTGSMKRQVLHTSMLEKLKHFLDWINDLNVGNDAALLTLVGKCKQALVNSTLSYDWGDGTLTDNDVNKGMDYLKKSNNFRHQVRAAFEELKQEFEAEDGGSDIDIKKKSDANDVAADYDSGEANELNFTIKKKANLPS